MSTDPTMSASQEMQKAESSSLMPLYEPHAEPAGIPLQAQTADLIQSLTHPETGTTYKNAAALTWALLKKAGLWLAYLAVTLFAVLVWICGIGFKGGHNFREWIEVKSPSVEEVVCAVLRVVAFPFVSLYYWANAVVKKTLGWEIQLNSLKLDAETTQPPIPDAAEPAEPTESTQTDAPATEAATVTP
jgi:hypothetical protein